MPAVVCDLLWFKIQEISSPIAPTTADGMAKIASQCDIANPEIASPSQTGEGQRKPTASAEQPKRLAKPNAPQVTSNGEIP